MPLSIMDQLTKCDSVILSVHAPYAQEQILNASHLEVPDGDPIKGRQSKPRQGTVQSKMNQELLMDQL